jgi:hypothetical protein
MRPPSGGRKSGVKSIQKTRLRGEAVVSEDYSMIVMIVYVLLVVAGEVAAFFIAQAFDSLVPAAWSMIFYMALFFGVIWGAWPVAVYVTEKWLVRGAAPHGEARRT